MMVTFILFSILRAKDLRQEMDIKSFTTTNQASHDEENKDSDMDSLDSLLNYVATFRISIFIIHQIFSLARDWSKPVT